MRRGVTTAALFAFAASSLGSMCEDSSAPNPPQLINIPKLAITPATLTQGVGATGALTVAAYEAASGVNGRPLPLKIELEANGVLQPLGAGSVKRVDGGEVTFMDGTPPIYNTFLPANVETKFELRVTCVKEGSAKVTAKDGTVSAVAEVTCTPNDAGLPEGGVDAGARPPREFANGIAELITVTRNASTFTFTRGGVATNLGERTPDMRAKYTEIGDHCEKFDGITNFLSVPGIDKVDVNTGAQTGAATFNAGSSKYTWSGFHAGTLFGVEGKVKFTVGSELLEVTAPDYAPPNMSLSAPAGGDTKVYVPNTSDPKTYLAIYGALQAGSGFSCLWRVAELELDPTGQLRMSPFINPLVRASLPNVDADLQSLYITYANGMDSAQLFPPLSRTVMSGRVLKFNRTDIY